ncbi:MAG: phosphoribosylanthranilate isomerase, partial [Spirochaetaceae bacterium]
DFWQRIAVHRRRPQPCPSATAGNGRADGNRPARPLVKICGITNREDAEAAVRAGADILGFVYAPSPRRAPDDLPARLADLDVLKVAVVVCAADAAGTAGDRVGLPGEVAAQLAGGHIDALQFHGDESPAQCAGLATVPAGGPRAYYKALRLQNGEDAALIERYRSPRVLIDAFDPVARGGTGKRIAPGLVTAAAARLPLWLAGGIGVDNVAEIIREWRPELIDASSRLESEPGRKDHARLRAFFRQIDKETQDAGYP